MFTKTGKLGKINHVFTSEKEFLFQEDWILKTKGKEIFDAWKLRDGTENSNHPDSIALYEEWLEAEGVTHTMSEDEE
jgi:hypothetical protein